MAEGPAAPPLETDALRQESTRRALAIRDFSKDWRGEDNRGCARENGSEGPRGIAEFRERRELTAAAPRRETSRGTRPEGAASETDAARHVREMFSRIAPRYDFLNNTLPFQPDRTLRRRPARVISGIAGRARAESADLGC